MTNVVKHTSVVDDRAVQGPVMREPQRRTAVLKREAFDGAAPVLNGRDTAPPPQSPRDELNRLKIELKEAREELRALRRRLEEEEPQAESRADGPEPDAAGMEEKLKELVHGARAQAEEILGAAKAEGEALREQAKNEGYLEGFSKGFEEASQEFRQANEPKARQLERTLQLLSEYEIQMMQRQERGLVSLVIAVAGKVIGGELQADPQLVCSMLREAVEKNRREEYVKITLSPDLLPVEAPASEEIRNLLLAMGTGVSVETDKGLPAGSAFVETPKGVTDASISTQLNNLEEILLSE